MIKIAWLCTQLDPGGGLYTHISYWAKLIDKSKYQITLISSDSDDGLMHINAIKNNGITSVHLAELGHAKRKPIKLIDKLATILGELDVDILHTIHIQNDIFGAFAATKAKTPFIVSSLEGEAVSKYSTSSWKIPIYKVVYKTISNRMTAYIAISNATKYQFCREFNVDPMKISVIRNGVDPGLFPWEKSLKLLQERIINKEIILGYLGRLRREKGIINIIQAFERILQYYPKARLSIIGEGEDKHLCESETRRLDISRSVSFSASVGSIQTAMLTFDILLLPSKTEGMPWAILESMACAKPVIASNIGGIPEVIEDGKSGLLIKSDDPDSIAKAVQSLLHDNRKAIEMGECARRRIESNFSCFQEIKQLEDFYDGVYSNGY